jgi:hypothetical protein
MIFFSVGLPGRFAEFCDALTLRLVEQSLGATGHGAFNTLEDIARAAIRSETAHLVAGLRQPVVRLQTEIVQSGRPFLVTLGDVYSAVRELAQRPGYDQIAATREVASSCAAMLTLATAPKALVLPDECRGDPTALAAAIARHFGFALNPSDIARIAESVWIDNTPEPMQDVSSDDDLVSGALEPYARFFGGSGDLRPIVWESDLFFAAQNAEDGARVPARGIIDITGRARFLIFGPYINLAPGTWIATVALGFSAETSGMSFIIEIAAGTQLTYTRVQPIGEQMIETNLSFTIQPSTDHPVEIRVISERAAFDGRIALGNVRLARRGGGQRETEHRLIASLRR